MAKAKKQEKSIEQRLEEALVLYEKTPYELPSNWCWVKLEDLTNITAGGTPARNNHRYWDNGQIPWVKISDLSGKYVETTEERITQLGLDNSSAKIFKKGTILYTIFATIGEVAILNIDAATNQAIAGITCKEPYNLDYMYYVLLVLKDLLVSKAKGVAQVNINQSILKETPIPLAPIEEQKRIIEIIEKQFAKLDEARDLIQKSLDSFADRKSAILHKAFTGELTKQWSENNGRAFSFKRKRFDEVAKIKSNLVEPSEYLDMPHIAPDCIEKFTGKLIGYKTIREDGVFSSKHRCYKNQILYSKIRPNLSKLIIAEFDCLCSADMYPIEANENVKYLFYAMLSSEFLEQASNAGSRSVLPKINQKELSRLFIDIPNIDEQEEIVRILDSIFEKEDKSKELIDMLDKIDEMKKSILARAFRGELGTSNPTDEPAIDLLKKILEQNN